MFKKIGIAIIAFVLGVQIIAPNSLLVNANTDNAQVSNVDSIKAEVVGVEGITETEIALGGIKHNEYEGYTFVNATVQDAVVDYIGVHEDDLYYTNKGKSDFGSFLLGNSVVKLNYEKAVSVFTIDYDYDEMKLSIVGPSKVDNGGTLMFRIEAKGGYRVTSVIGNGQLLKADEDGYYIVRNIKMNMQIEIESEAISKYNVSIKNDYVAGRELSGKKTVNANENWKGTISTQYATLNSIILNNEYLNVPNGSKNETKTTTLKDGTIVTVSVALNYILIPAGNHHTYTVEVKNVKSDLHFIPALYDDVHDVTWYSIKGLNVYHWTGSELRLLEMGDMVKKNNATDVFFVAAKPGFEAEISKLDGNGTKIIERLNAIADVKNVPGGYENAKAEAQAIGCNYLMYYSDKTVKKRTAYIESKMIQYDVAYDVEGAVVQNPIEDNNRYDIEKNNIITVSAIVPIKTGYTFTGWMNKDTKEIVQPQEEIMINEKLANALTTNTIKLKALWTKNEEMKTSSYTIQYFFQDELGNYVENEQYSKTIKNAPVGETAILIDLQAIDGYEFNPQYIGNILSAVVKNGNNETLKAYYVKAVRNIIYDKGSAVQGEAPVDMKNPYNIGENATILGNTGQLIGAYEDRNDVQFVCWKSEGKYFYAGDVVTVNDGITFTPVFVGDLYNDQTVLNFTAGENGKIVGQSKFAVPRDTSFGKVITNKDILPVVDANLGYAFDGWYVANEKVAPDAATLYDYVKGKNRSLQIEARFVKNDQAKHDITYKVLYYKGDTLADAHNAIPEEFKYIEYDVWSGIESVNPVIVTDKYHGYVIDPTNLDTLPEAVKDGETIHVYYVKDSDKWTTVKFIAGNGLLNGSNHDVITEEALIGGTFSSQKITVPNVTANTGWIFKNWDIVVDKDTIILKDMVITAQYSEDRNGDQIPDDEQYVTVKFDAGTHGNYKDKQYVIIEKMLPGDTIKIPMLSIDKGYIFKEYDTEVINRIPSDFTDKAINYTAQYVEDKNGDQIPDDEQYVIVIFDAGEHGDYAGEQVVKTEKMLPGDTIETPTLTVDGGYEFTNYDTEVLASIPTDFMGEVLTYTAQYSEIIITPTPVPPLVPTIPPVTPVGPVGPAAPLLVVPTVPAPPVATPNAPVETVTPDETPKSNGTEIVKENATPKAKGVDGGNDWTLLNLIAAIGTLLIGLVVVMDKKKETETSKRFANAAKAVASILAIVSIALFIFTQDMTQTMALVDQWSFVMLAIMVVQIATLVIVKKGFMISEKRIQEN